MARDKDGPHHDPHLPHRLDALCYRRHFHGRQGEIKKSNIFQTFLQTNIFNRSENCITILHLACITYGYKLSTRNWYRAYKLSLKPSVITYLNHVIPLIFSIQQLHFYRYSSKKLTELFYIYLLFLKDQT